MIIGAKPNLDRIKFHPFMGHWNFSLVKHTLLNEGNFTGAVKMTFWHVFACDQQLKKTTHAYHWKQKAILLCVWPRPQLKNKI